MRSGLLIIDGTATLVRSQLAVREEEGRDDLALFFFVRSVIRFLKYHKPEYVLVAWDGPNAKDWRREIYPEYKRNRADGPSGRFDEDTLGSKAESFCIHTGMYSIRGPFEADDVISWGVWAAAAEGIETVFIRADDADMNQLVSPFVTQYPLSGDGPVMTQAAVIAKYGCAPVHLPRLRALAGDSSDNIPGVPGIGVKTAAKLLAAASNDLRLVDDRRLDGMRPAVLIFEQIMDLRERREAVHKWLPPLCTIWYSSRWHPAGSLPDARACFEHWGMKTLVKAADTGSLW